MNREINMQIPIGYRIVKEIKTVNLKEAEEILSGEEQHLYTEATRKGDVVELSSCYLICPHCNGHFVANSKNPLFCDGVHSFPRSVSAQTISEWCDSQISLFDDDEDSKLYLSSQIKKPPVFECPECKNASRYSDNSRRVKITQKRKKISIMSEIISIRELFLSDWLNSDSVYVTLPMYETMTFNLKRGSIHIKLTDEKGTVQCRKDITSMPELSDGCVASGLIAQNKNIRRSIKKMFCDVWSTEELPFKGKNICMETLFKMTAFVEYTNEFYRVIPYELTAQSIEKSFKSIAKKLHFSKNVGQMLKTSEIPDVKSVRRVFFCNFCN